MNDDNELISYVVNANKETQGRPVYADGESLAKYARILGIGAMITAVMFTVYLPVGLGACAIILALLSKRDDYMSPLAKSGITWGTTAIITNVIMVLASIYMLVYDPQTHAQVNVRFEQMYGQTFDTFMEDAKDGNFDLEYSIPMP